MAVFISIDAIPLSDPPTITRPSVVSLGGARTERFRTSGHTATSTPCTDPPFRSRISHDPSLPSISTEPEAPSPAARVRRFAVRMSVSVSHRYYTSLGFPSNGSTRTAMLTVCLHYGSVQSARRPCAAHTDPLQSDAGERKHSRFGGAKIVTPAI